MIVLYVLLAILFLLSCRKLKKSEKWNNTFISKETTNTIKGACIWVVFICHISSYLNKIPNPPFADILLFVANGYIKQLLVVPFLFYSGYGVTLAIKNKGANYANNIPITRCLTTMLNFDIAVLIFLLADLGLGRTFDLKTILLAFLSWESIGNSNWYIFCIVVCYAISWISYKICGIKAAMLCVLFLLVIGYSIIMCLFAEGPWWYDSVYAYAAGAIFAWRKDHITCFIRNHYLWLCLFSICGFVIFYNLPETYGIAPNITGLFLCLIILLLTNKIIVQGSLLSWSGKHLFPLYIYQRIPMLVLSSIGGGTFFMHHQYLYVFTCIISTIILAFLYKYVKISIKGKSLQCQK